MCVLLAVIFPGRSSPQSCGPLPAEVPSCIRKTAYFPVRRKTAVHTPAEAMWTDPPHRAGLPPPAYPALCIFLPLINWQPMWIDIMHSQYNINF